MDAPALLLTGATGFLGRRLARALSGRWRVTGAARRPGPGGLVLDLADPASIRAAFAAVRPAAVVHAGAVAGPDDCERDPALAGRVNRDGAAEVARLCAGSGARLVHLSTDLVFDGTKGRYTEDDAPRPVSVYGRVKAEAEEAVFRLAPGACAVRVSAAYGRPLPGVRLCFVDELVAALSAGRAVEAFADQWRSPTDGDQLPDAVSRLLERPGLSGPFHWGSAERASRHDVAVALCRARGYDERLVRPVSASGRTFLAPRPRDTSLDSSRAAKALGLAPRPLAEGLKL